MKPRNAKPRRATSGVKQVNPKGINSIYQDVESGWKAFKARHGIKTGPRRGAARRGQPEDVE